VPVGRSVHVLGVEKGLAVVEPVVDGSIILRVKVHVDGLREGGRGGGRGGGREGGGEGGRVGRLHPWPRRGKTCKRPCKEGGREGGR
jgi:hypothetical protein